MKPYCDLWAAAALSKAQSVPVGMAASAPPSRQPKSPVLLTNTKSLPQKRIHKLLQEAASMAGMFQSHCLTPLQEQSRPLCFIITVIKYLQRLTDHFKQARPESKVLRFPGPSEEQTNKLDSKRAKGLGLCHPDMEPGRPPPH